MNEKAHFKSSLLQAHPETFAWEHQHSLLQLVYPQAPSTEETIKVFFELLKAIHLDTWSYRKQFWLQYFEKGLISSAHLILAESLQELAQRNFQLQPSSYGFFHKDRHILPNQGVLLMRLHHVIVAEWSHIGKCRMWLQEQDSAPKLFQKAYSYHELIDYPTKVQQHYFSKAGLWQRDLGKWLDAKLSCLI
jgi:hypothetical protein